MTTAIIELNSLPDTVWPTAKNDDFLAIGWRRLVLFFVSGIEVWRVAFEFRRARIHQLEHGLQSIFAPEVTYFLRCSLALANLPQIGQPGIGDAHALGFAYKLR